MFHDLYMKQVEKIKGVLPDFEVTEDEIIKLYIAQSVFANWKTNQFMKSLGDKIQDL